LLLPAVLPLPGLRLRLGAGHPGRGVHPGAAAPIPSLRATPGGRMRRPALAVAVALLAAWSLAPSAWQLLTAFKPDDQITRVPTVYFPDPPTTEHLSALWTRKPLPVYLANSVGISSMASLLCVLVASLAAAGLSRSTAAFRARILLALLFPLNEGGRAVGWINHPLGLVLPYAALNLPLAVWILESGFRQIPREVDEAAQLDGLGLLARVVRVQAPLAAPSVATAAILVFIFCWNEFMLALT